MDVKDESQQSEVQESPREPRRLFSLRNVGVALGVSLGSVLVFLAIIYGLYRFGTFDSYIKDQFVTKLDEIGIRFTANKLQVAASPLELVLKDATFEDKITGERLLTIRDARLGLSVLDLLAWRLSRDISIDSTDVSGAELWIKVDENGKSNFSNLKIIDDEQGQRVNFRYDSVRVNLTDSVIHFGDLSRKVSGNANDLTVTLTPTELKTDSGDTRFGFQIASNGSDFSYEESKFEKIDIRANGVADPNGAVFDKINITSPMGEIVVNGKLDNWASPTYTADISWSIDLTQISQSLATSTAIRGVGNFNGTISGSGENYKIDGRIDSEALRSDGIYLKAVNVEGTVNGTNSNYEANGSAVAEMLTFDDFRIDFLKLHGNVRGTGYDFRWFGELQAVAAKTPSMTIGGLYLSDALAEYKDRELAATAGNGRAKRFAIGDTEFADLAARNLKFSTSGNNVTLSANTATAGKFKTPEIEINNVTGRNIQVSNREKRTTANVDGLKSNTANISGAMVRNLSADKLKFEDNPKDTNLTISGVKAGSVDSDGTVVSGIDSAEININSANGTTIVYADRSRVASIDTGSAVLGSLSIAGVRLTIRNGVVQGRSDDIDAGTINIAKSAQLAQGGKLENVRLVRPIFVLERAGRYRASADMSLGGGAIGSIALGAASARVEVSNEVARLTNINAQVMDGSVAGAVDVAINSRARSNIDLEFVDLDLSKLIALQTARIVPLVGKASGTAKLTYPGNNFKLASGSIDGRILANAGSDTDASIPINGNIALRADQGVFTVSDLTLATAESQLSGRGQFDLNADRSNLTVALKSSNSAELQRLFEVTAISPEINEQLQAMELKIGGGSSFDGDITGNLFDPTVVGKVFVENITIRERPIGSVATNLRVDPTGIELRDGRLTESSGGVAEFAASIPYGGTNNISIDAELKSINAGNLLAALPVFLPERIRDLDGSTSGKIQISGLPNNASGSIDLVAAKGTIAGQPYDDLKTKINFNGTVVDFETIEMAVAGGKLTGKGSYDRAKANYNFEVAARAIPLATIISIFPQNASIPAISGSTDLTLTLSGNADRNEALTINGNGTARDVVVGENSLGDIIFDASTANQKLTAKLMVSFDGRPQVVNAVVDFGNEALPLTASAEFNNSPLAPFLSFVPQLKGFPLNGTGTGRIDVIGELSRVAADGSREMTTELIRGSANFSALNLVIQDTPLSSSEPVVFSFNDRELNVESAKFSGGGSNISIRGTKAFSENAVNDLSVDGIISLNLLNLATKDVFFAGLADVSIRLTGTNAASRISGTSSTETAAVAAFVGKDRLTLDRIKSRIVFSADQADIEEMSGYLGGGKFTATGGAQIKGLGVDSFRLSLNGSNVTVPLPADFLTTGDARLEITGIRPSTPSDLQITIGGRVYARRSLYSKDIDLANVVGARRERAISSGGGSVTPPRFDLVIEGRDALVVRNNIADLTASVSLVLTGDANEPRLSGRVTANSGTLFYRKDRYVVQRGVLEFPPDTSIDPIINLQAESEIGGYQIFITLAGPLKDTERLVANVRSVPALPSDDVISLITTGSLTNTAGGIPTLAQTGINTAAEILTDSIINNPARKATDKLFGLNVFEIDPIISGQQLNPSARLTVGRQINNNLRVTYSTNLSQDQNQLLALEYRVSNKLSFVAQYEQRSLSNVTRNRDNFSLEVRFRKRF